MHDCCWKQLLNRSLWSSKHLFMPRTQEKGRYCCWWREWAARDTQRTANCSDQRFVCTFHSSSFVFRLRQHQSTVCWRRRTAYDGCFIAFCEAKDLLNHQSYGDQCGWARFRSSWSEQCSELTVCRPCFVLCSAYILLPSSQGVNLSWSTFYNRSEFHIVRLHG